MTSVQTFTGVIVDQANGSAYVAVGFDPDAAWGGKTRHHVTGSVGGIGIRGSLTKVGEQYRLPLGPAWLRGSRVRPGDPVEVVLRPEGPQRADLDPDVAEALEAEPEAGAFFDSLAQFYRKKYLSWVGATKRRPDVRAQRIAEMVELLRAGHKQRPPS